MNEMKIVDFMIKILEFKNVKHFLTGSCAFGVDTKDSDFDIAILSCQDIRQDIQNIFDFLDVKNTKLNYGDEGIKFKLNDVEFNFIILKQSKYDSWNFATDTLIELSKKENIRNKIKDKTVRVKMFEMLVNINYGLDLDDE